MRLRIQTLPPLPELKVWFIPRPTNATLSLNTIAELKRALCHDIKLLQSEGIQHYDIRLLLDGFELLGDLPYHEILRDGDLVCVQVFKEPRLDIEASKKRRAVEDVEDLEGARKRRKKSVEKKASGKVARQSTSSSSSSGSSESSSASSESSESESSESSEPSSSRRSTSPSSSSSSSVSSPPIPQCSKRRIKTIARISNAISIPPGYGKPSTKSRNRRRRMKRKYEREEKEEERAPPQGVSEANLTPLGPAQTENPIEGFSGLSATESRAAKSQSQSTSIPGNVLDNTNGEVMMASLRNKNKRKNFRQTMVAPAVRKIVFDDSEDARLPNLTASTSTQESISTESAAQETIKSLNSPNKDVSTVSSLQTRVIPPSQLAALGRLPSNVLVTSVEFGRHVKKKNRRTRDTNEEEQVTNELRPFDWYGHEASEDRYDADNANVYLPYGEAEDGRGDVVEKSAAAQFDWKAAETGWERFPPIETLDQLYSGVLVSWQGLAINPQTFTPEHLLGVGRVEKVENTSIIIRQIIRPGTETAAAFGIANESGDGEGEDEEYSWGDISSLGWKIVDFSKSNKL